MKALATSCCIVPLLLCVSAPQSAGQTLEPGQRVRVATSELAGGRLVAEVLRIEPDSLVLQREGVSWALSRSSITGIEVASGAHRHTLHGALVGSLVVGAAVGQDMLRKPGQCSGSGNYGQLCAMFLTGAMLGGAVLGAIIGAVIRHDDWIAVSLEAPHAGTNETSHLRLPLQFSISIRSGVR